MKTENTKQEKINWVKKYMDSTNLLSDNFIDLLYNLCTNDNIGNKQELLRLSGYTRDQLNKVDTAIPIDYSRQIKEIYPNFKGLNHCYDYNKNKFGELVNSVELFGEYVINICYNKF